MKIKKLTIKDVINFLNSKNHKIISSNSQTIENFNSINSSIKGELTFCSVTGKEGMKLIKNSKASLILCPIELKDKFPSTKKNLIFTENPRLEFIKCMKKFVNFKIPLGIDDSAVVRTKKIGKNVYIGPLSYIAKNVIIGDNTKIDGNVFIYDNVKIGKNVIIHAASVIGTDGFGYERTQEMKLEKFPHIGGVKIMDDVEIGSNSCIDKGTLHNTIIGSGTKIDNLVHIAHNVKIGKNCAIIANSFIGGSCIIEDDVHVAMSVTVRDKIKIGKQAFIGMGSVVIKNVNEKEIIVGNPGRSIKK